MVNMNKNTHSQPGPAQSQADGGTTGSRSAQVTLGPSLDENVQNIRLRYNLASTSFANLLKITKSPSRQDVLRVACFCTEFSVYDMTPAEKPFFREVNDHTSIPYRVSETPARPWHKVFLLIQIDLSKQRWPHKLSTQCRKDLLSQRGRILRLLEQILRCVVDILGHRGDGRGVSVALDVLRSVKAGVWEGGGMELLQVDGIGQAKLEKLFSAGVKTISKLAGLEFYHIERLLSRNPPFGQSIKHQIAGFPLLSFTTQVCTLKKDIDGTGSSESGSSATQRWILRMTMAYLNPELPKWKNNHPWTTLVIEGADGRLVWFWRGSVKRLTDRKEVLVSIYGHKGEMLQATFACETLVGTLQRHEIKLEGRELEPSRTTHVDNIPTEG